MIGIDKATEVLYTPSVGGPMPQKTLGNPVEEKYDLLLKMIRHQIPSEHIGKKIKAIDDRYRSPSAIVLKKVVAACMVVVAPFLAASIAHASE